jgi:peroxiredoxin Q/BCP
MLGKKFPSFRLETQDGKEYTTADLAGRWWVLYAYPKAMTSGCTLESQQFRDALPKFAKLGASVLGISADEAKRQKQFAEKESLPFPLLADPEKTLLTKLGIWVEKSLYGRKYMGIERSTFLVDPTGKVAAEWHKVKVPGHAAEVLEKLRELQA